MSKETLTSTFTELRNGFLRLAMRFLPNKEDADDALQEAFFRLWKHADQIGSREEAEALTVVTVKNLCIDTLRKKNHLPTVELDENRDDSISDSAADSLEKEERFRMVERIIELRLTPLQQQILQTVLDDRIAEHIVAVAVGVCGHLKPSTGAFHDAGGRIGDRIFAQDSEKRRFETETGFGEKVAREGAEGHPEILRAVGQHQQRAGQH